MVWWAVEKEEFPSWEIRKVPVSTQLVAEPSSSRGSEARGREHQEVGSTYWDSEVRLSRDTSAEVVLSGRDSEPVDPPSRIQRDPATRARWTWRNVRRGTNMLGRTLEHC